MLHNIVDIKGILMPKILSVHFFADRRDFYRGGFKVNDGLWIVLLFVALALVLTCAGIGVSLLFSPHYYHSKEQRETFECGIDTEGTAWVNFRVGYYMYALVFLLFDIETVFFFPLALAFKSVGLFPVVAGTVFLVLLCIGLWYEWKEGALEWK